MAGDMDIEVHSFSREISQRRSIVTAAFLLVICCGLGWGMSWRRANDPLAPVLTPSEWKVRFSVPRGFETGEEQRTRQTSALPFYGKTAGGVNVYCILWRGRMQAGIDLEMTAKGVLEDIGKGVNWFGEARTNPATSAPMGKQDGLELLGVAESAVIRIIEIESEAYAVLFATQRGKLDSDAMRLFDLTCRSMEMR